MRRMPPLLLVVDDDETNAAALKAWLLAEGYNAVTASSCLEAEAVVAALPLDGLIGQLALPDGSLFTIARALRARRPGAMAPPGQRTPPIIAYADVDIGSPRELDLCLLRPLDLAQLRSFLKMRFSRGHSGEHRLIDRDRRHGVPPARTSARRR